MHTYIFPGDGFCSRKIPRPGNFFRAVLDFAPLVVAGSLPFCAIRMFLGTQVRGQAAPPIANLLYLAMAYLGALWFPLPKSAQWISWLSPAWHLDVLARHSLGIAAPGSTVVHVAVWIAVTVGFTALAVRRLARVGCR